MRRTIVLTAAAGLAISSLLATALYPYARGRFSWTRIFGPGNGLVTFADLSLELPDVDFDHRPVFVVSTNPFKLYNPATRALHRFLAKTLTTYSEIPADRAKYFAQFNDLPAWRIVGWTGMVEKAVTNEGGYLVTVSVSADLYSPHVGNTFSVDYHEFFQVTNGIVRYVGYSDPYGRAGVFPFPGDSY